MLHANRKEQHRPDPNNPATPVVSNWANRYLSTTDTGFKKRLLGWIRLAIGMGVVAATNQMLLKIVAPTLGGGLLDMFITALGVSTGTEGFNSILKYVTYAKDKQGAQATTAKAQSAIEIAKADQTIAVSQKAVAEAMTAQRQLNSS